MPLSRTTVQITPGVGTPVDVMQLGSGADQQIVRPSQATASPNTTPWTASTTAANVISADIGRCGMMLVSNASGITYFGFGSVNAAVLTASLFNYYLQPGERWEVPYWLAPLAVAMLASAVGGTVLITLPTDA